MLLRRRDTINVSEQLEVVMEPESEDMKVSLVISKATILIIVYFVIYIISDIIVSLVYTDGSYILLMLLNFLMFFFTFKNILKPLLFKQGGITL
ncbi:hypothetical protein JL49_14235, partial [Pseudoalteromonas luteoviolacea]